jgi:hypothetical protein
MFRPWENKFEVLSTNCGNENHYDSDSDSDSDFNYLESTDGEDRRIDSSE